MNSQGRLFVIEGPDGTGKTSLSKAVCREVKEQGVNCVWASFPGREPETLGQLVYTLHHNPGQLGVASINPISIQILHVAAHVDAIAERILPTLASGISIVLDRYWWSTWVYGKASGITERTLTAMLMPEHEQWGDVKPAIVFLIDSDKPHRIGEASESWYNRKMLYQELAERESGGYSVEIIHNNGQPEDAIHNIAQSILAISNRNST